MRGTGSLSLDAEELLPSVEYEVNEGMKPNSVLKRITGRLFIDVPTGLRLMSLPMGPSSDMVLHMEDGRRWHCNLSSSHGTLSNRAGFED